MTTIAKIPTLDKILFAETPDFVEDTHTFWDTARKIVLSLLKIVIYPWAIYEVVKYLLQRTIMTIVYPAQSFWLKRYFFNQPELIEDSLKVGLQLTQKCTIRPVRLDKNGVKICGWALEVPGSKKWVLQTAGNRATVANYVPKINDLYADAGFNTLLIDNPGVGFSQGDATPQTIGETQAFAIKYLEEERGAEQIVLAGHSIGGGAIGQAALRHKFKKSSVKYLVVQQMTFGRLSHAAKKMAQTIDGCFWFCVRPIASPLIRGMGLEMDNVRASQRLSELGIPEHIINQREPAWTIDKDGVIDYDNRRKTRKFRSDGVIPGKATLGHQLFKNKIVHLKTTDYDTEFFDHNSDEPFLLTAKIIKEWDQKIQRQKLRTQKPLLQPRAV